MSIRTVIGLLLTLSAAIQGGSGDFIERLVAIAGGRVSVESLGAELIVDTIYRNSSIKG